MPGELGALLVRVLPISPCCGANKPPRVFSEGMRAGRRFRVCPPVNDLAMEGVAEKQGARSLVCIVISSSPMYRLSELFPLISR